MPPGPTPNTTAGAAPRRVWTQADIIAALANREARITKLAQRVGLERSTLSKALTTRDMAPSHRIIAAAIGATLHELFPDWYGPDNKPLPPPLDHG